jgi:peptidoglycan-N-acetylglucosamine deacetylase
MARRKDAVVAALVLLAGFALVAVAARDDAPGTPAGLRPGLAAAGLPEMRAARRRGAARHRSEARAVARVLRRRTVIRRGSRREREIALTFDDGPGPYTRAVVRALRRGGARATFFPVSSLFRRWPRALDAVRRAGFAVGDHTVDHPYLPGLSFRAQLRQLRGQARALRHHGFPRPRLMRPPYGGHDRRTRVIARRLGMLVVMWSVDSGDYTRPGRRAIVRNVLRGARPGAIVLMHDGGGPRAQTVAALPRIVRALRRRGYRLVTVPELLARRR